MGYALTQLAVSETLEEQTFQRLYNLYQSTISALEVYAQHVPGKDDLKDRKYAIQETQLLKVQEEVIQYAASRPVQTAQDAEALTSLWYLLIGPDANECSLMTNRLASKLISFRLGST